jgi:hypothetical protein
MDEEIYKKIILLIIKYKGNINNEELYEIILEIGYIPNFLIDKNINLEKLLSWLIYKNEKELIKKILVNHFLEIYSNMFNNFITKNNDLLFIIILDVDYDIEENFNRLINLVNNNTNNDFIIFMIQYYNKILFSKFKFHIKMNNLESYSLKLLNFEKDIKKDIVLEKSRILVQNIIDLI